MITYHKEKAYKTGGKKNKSVSNKLTRFGGLGSRHKAREKRGNGKER